MYGAVYPLFFRLVLISSINKSNNVLQTQFWASVQYSAIPLPPIGPFFDKAKIKSADQPNVKS